MTYLKVLTHTSFPEQIAKSAGPITVYCTYMFSKDPSCAFLGFWTLTLMLTQHFDLIYDIGKSAIIHLDRPHIAEYHENRSR